jgi:hypothetical protein
MSVSVSVAAVVRTITLILMEVSLRTSDSKQISARCDSEQRVQPCRTLDLWKMKDGTFVVNFYTDYTTNVNAVYDSVT